MQKYYDDTDIDKMQREWYFKKSNLYSNFFENNTSYCQHSKPFILCDADDIETFNFNREKLGMTMAFVNTAKDDFINSRFNASSVPQKEGKTMWESDSEFDSVLEIINRLSLFRTCFSVRLKDFSITLHLYPKDRKIPYSLRSKLCNDFNKEMVDGELEDYIYACSFFVLCFKMG